MSRRYYFESWIPNMRRGFASLWFVFAPKVLGVKARQEKR